MIPQKFIGKRRYLIFIVSIILVIVSSQFIIQYDLGQQNLDANLINVAGRQRMLSQRIAKLVLFLNYNQDENRLSTRYRIDSLQKISEEWRSIHYHLLETNRTQGNSKTIDSLLNINTPHVEHIANACNLVVNNPNQATFKEAIDLITESELPFLLTMEKTVKTYQQEAEAKLATIKRVELVLSALAIFILLGEFVFIILPILKQLQFINKKLKNANTNLITISEEVKKQLSEIQLLKQDLEVKQILYVGLVDAATDMIYELDKDGNFSFINPMMEQVTGYTRQELIGELYTSLIHDQDITRVVDFYKDQRNKRQENSYLEFRLKSKTLGNIWIGQNVRMFFNDSWIYKVSAVARDITAIKEAEFKLQEERILMRTIIDNIPINIYAKNLNSEKILVNKAEYEFLGAESEDELLGKQDFDLFPVESATLSRAEDEQVFAGHAIINKETLNEKKDGIKTWFLISKVPLRNSANEIIGLVGISIDITERKKALEELARKEQLYRLVSENSQDVISLHKTDGTFEYISPACVALHGYEPEELVGRIGTDFIYPDDASKILEDSPRVLEQMRLQQPLSPSQFRLVTKKRGLVWVENLIKPIFQDGELTGFQSTLRDITARKEYERELQDAKLKAEAATQAKSQFLGMMSHEIRTPLNGILGFTNIMLSENPRPDQVEHLNLLKFSGENLLAIINDILDFSKVESGMMILERIPFQLKDIVSRNIKLLEERANRNGIELRVKLDDSLPQVVIGDPVRLGQVINNLVGNAIKFTEKGFVEVELHVLNKIAEQHQIKFTIRDSGIGIPEDKINSIFERFNQASSDTTRKFGGTGLGLSITKRILELMGSKIMVSSKLGEGSIFSFTLTMTESRITNGFQAETKTDKPLSGHILLVEDNPVNQTVARSFLAKWGFKITIANNGEEGLKAIASKEFDLVLMDIYMPQLDGYTATQRIRAMGTDYFSRIPIIALTADVSPEIRKQTNEAGMNDILSKPFLPEDLHAVLKKYLYVKEVNTSNFSSKLSPYTAGDPMMEMELTSLIIKNLEELKMVIAEASHENDLNMLNSILHKNKTTLTILNDTALNLLIEKIQDTFETVDSPLNRIEVSTSIAMQCDELIQSIRL